MDKIEEFVSREEYERLLKYRDLLLRWNKVINLVSSRAVNDILNRHILDSVQILKFINNKNVSIIDVGSGAGFPGVVLSICGINDVTLIESDSRKVAFLLQSALLSPCKIKIKNDRVENLKGLECDIMTARAFSSLESIFDYTERIKVRDKYLLHKGKSYGSELLKARSRWLFNVQIHDSITSDYGKILEITDLESAS